MQGHYGFLLYAESSFSFHIVIYGVLWSHLREDFCLFHLGFMVSTELCLTMTNWIIKFRGNCCLTVFSFISCPSLKMYPNDSCCHIRLAWQSICVSCCRGPHRRFLPILAGVQPRFLGCTSTLVSCWYATVFWWTSEPFLIPSRDLGEFKVTVCGLKSGELVLSAVLASRYVPVTAELPKLRSDFLILSGFQVW